jgi:hypothetical protein
MGPVRKFIASKWLAMVGLVFLIAALIFFVVGAAGRGVNAVLVGASLLVIYGLDRRGAKG